MNQTWFTSFLLALASMLICSALAAEASGQEQQEQIPPPSSAAPAGPVTTVHGIVRNGASGEPLPRALVRMNGDASTGALTDGEGRFEISGVPTGPQEFQIMKPGFLDQAEAAADSFGESSHGYARNVIVVANMPDVVFTLSPVNSIRGQIQLFGGDPAQGIQVTLLKRIVQDGRAVWQAGSNAKTNSDGVYRFGGLSDGSYALYTEPAMDSDTATNLVDTGSGNNVARNGYGSLFYPESQDLAGAAKIRLKGGDEAQANFSLTLEPFHPVTATVVLPGRKQDAALSAEQSGMNYSVLVMDGQGRTLPYTAQYDAATRSIQAFLPDGSYSFFITAMASPSRIQITGSHSMLQTPATMTGQIGFSVSGRAVSNLRIPVSPTHSSPVQVAVTRTSTESQGASGVFVTLSQSGGWNSGGMVSSYAQGTSEGPLETTYTPPGSYWVHTSIAQKWLCEASFTAGGSNLAREPLVLGIGGAAAPLSLALRDDCASLTVSLPASVAGNVAGVERFYTIFVVPDFDSTEDVVPQTLRPSTGGTITVSGLTPGNYHVHAFDRPVALEYRNPAALAAQRNPGRAVTLSPGAKADVVVEVAQP
jgi:Carboxypeptidase regulatory-like domain